jgi:hypothetical protein
VASSIVAAIAKRPIGEIIEEVIKRNVQILKYAAIRVLSSVLIESDIELLRVT